MGRKYKSYVKPDWFDLSKYAGLEGFNGSNWYEQIIVRSYIFDRFDPSLLPRTLSYWGVKESPGKIYQAIKIDPLSPMAIISDEIHSRRSQSNSKVVPDIKKKQIFKKKLGSEFSDLRFPSVRPTSMADVCAFMEAMPIEARQMYEEDRSELDPSYKYFDDPINTNRWCRYPASLGKLVGRGDQASTNSISLIVDLNLTNKQIIEEFKSLISTVRKKEKFNAQKFSKASLSQLVDARVLPYIDLIIYSQRERLRIPDHAIGDWLFPDEDIGVTDKIRKTTKPLAKKVYEKDYQYNLVKIN